MYICICIHTYLSVLLLIYYMYRQVPMCVYAYKLCMYRNCVHELRTCICTGICICIRIHIYIYTHTYMYVYMCVYIYIYMCIHNI